MTDTTTQSSNTDNRLKALCDRVGKEFQQRFGCEPSHLVAAPGRVNLIGEHIDYNDGFVLPMAIERYVVIAANPVSQSDSSVGTIFSSDLDQNIEISLCPSADQIHRNWGQYLEGVIAGFLKLGVEIPPFQAAIGSNIPQGGGLSSSAALEVATATLLESLTGHVLAPVDKALLCQQAEHDYAGVPCGIMDQYSSVFGRADELMLIDCRDNSVEFVPFKGNGVSVLIINSKVKHQLVDGEYAKRRSQCDAALKKLNLPSWRDVQTEHFDRDGVDLCPIERSRASHVVSEIRRTMDTASAIPDGQWQRAGELMYASHRSLRDDYEVSCPELDTLVQAAEDIGIDGGVFGSRMTGGGFGGCTVTLVQSEKLEEIRGKIHATYQTATGIEPESFASRPALGAHVLQSPEN